MSFSLELESDIYAAVFHLPTYLVGFFVLASRSYRRKVLRYEEVIEFSRHHRERVITISYRIK